MRFLLKIGAKILGSGARKIAKKGAKKAGKRCFKTVFKTAGRAVAKRAGKGVTVLFGGAIIYRLFNTATDVISSIGSNLHLVICAISVIFVIYVAISALNKLRSN